MERIVGVEDSRGKLGKLIEEVASTNEPIVMTKRGHALAVLVSRDEYARLKALASKSSRAELAARLAKVRREVARAGLESDVIDEAIEAARGIE